MNSVGKQAIELREQISKQQQQHQEATSDRFGGIGVEGPARFETKLEKLYTSTRAGEHLQRDIVQYVKDYIGFGSRQYQLRTKLSEDGRKYAAEISENSSDLSKFALDFGNALAKIEKEQADLLSALSSQVSEPLSEVLLSAPLEDARNLAQRYETVKQEVEAQAVEVSKSEAQVKRFKDSSEYVVKLEAAESKIEELKSSMATLFREATAAMAAAEALQRKVTLQRLKALVEVNRNYCNNITLIFDQLKAISELSGVGVEGPELEQHQRLEKLYISTSAGERFQRDVIRCVEVYVFYGLEQARLATKLSKNIIRKYAAADSTDNASHLSKVALDFGNAFFTIKIIHVDFLCRLSSLVARPLRAIAYGPPLPIDDARHVKQRYDRVRQEVEAQTVEVAKCKAEVREFKGCSENVAKLEAAESKLEELKSCMDTSWSEAAAAMAAVEAQQQTVTLQRLRHFVEANRFYHHEISQNFDQLVRLLETSLESIPL